MQHREATASPIFLASSLSSSISIISKTLKSIFSNKSFLGSMRHINTLMSYCATLRIIFALHIFTHLYTLSMAVTNFHRENIYSYQIDAPCPASPSGIRIVDIGIVINPEGSDGLEQAQKELLSKCLIEFDGSSHASARAIGVSIRTIYNWIKKYELDDLKSEWSREISEKKSL